MIRPVRWFPRLHRLSQWSERRFTPAGKVVGGAAFAAGIFGIDASRSVAYQMFAVGIALMGTAWLLSLRWRPHVVVDRRLPVHAVHGVPLTYTIGLRLERPASASALEVRDELAPHYPTEAQFRAARSGPDTANNAFDRRVGFLRWLALSERLRGGTLAPVSLPQLRKSQPAHIDVSFTPARRGILRFSAVRVLRPDPLGLVNASLRVELPHELLVLPRVLPVPRLALPGRRRHHRGEHRHVPQVGESQEFLQLRDYRPGDPLRRIHWPSSARAGRLVVKEMGEEYFARYALVLDTFATSEREAAFEAAVSTAASVAGAIDLGDAFLDLMFVEDRAVTVSAGRQGALPVGLLRELALALPARAESFGVLAAQVMARAGEFAACIHVLLATDEPRVGMVRALQRRGIAQVVLAVDCPGAPASIEGVAVYGVRSDDLAASLAALRMAAW